MKTNRIITGDACHELPKLSDASFQAIIADPPYPAPPMSKPIALALGCRHRSLRNKL